MNMQFNFKNLIFGILVFPLAVLLVSCDRNKALIPSQDFGAYYTHIITNDEFEKYSRTGDYADIIVDLGNENGKFVFWRGSSYLPYWETEEGEKVFVDEIIPRKGNGSKIMPDKTNSFSAVKIIDNSSSKVVVHWRYLPVFGPGNPYTGVIATSFVDEYFTFSPNGTVQRTIKQGTPKYDDWADPKFEYLQTFNLTTNGIANKVLTQPVRSLVGEKKTGRPVISESIVKPVAWFRFDEGIGDSTYESLTNYALEIKGTQPYWRQGISGTALQFDDVSTYLSLPASLAPKPQEAITLESWISIGAYPWSWCPIIQQADDVPENLLDKGEPGMGFKYIPKQTLRYEKEDDRGYFLGIDGDGHPGMKIRVGGNWEELTSDVHLERKTWYHIAGTYNKELGKIALYLNGKPVCEKKVATAGDIELSAKNLQIGRGKDRRQIYPVRSNTFPGTYSFDGLMDEIKIYNVALTPEQIGQSFNNNNTTPQVLALVDLPARILPEGGKPNTFGANYEALSYFDTWDNLFRFSKGADVVVCFDNNPCKFVFWRGVSYIPMMVNEKNHWYTNEFNETWNKSGGHGCMEPMSDKGSFFSHVRILENTPARVVIHWRFCLPDVEYVLANYNDTTGWSDWSDWYYYIYPDGVAVKKMQIWTNGERNHQFQESIAVYGPDQHPHDIAERKNMFTMLAEDGNFKTYDWLNSPPDNIKEPKNANIQLINYIGDYDPFTIVTKIERSDVYDGEITPYAVFPSWNHWPIAQMPSDGRYASYPDRTSHSSFSNLYFPIVKEATGDKPYYEKELMEGMWNKKPTELIPLSKSWTHAPGLTNLKGAEGAYATEQRAYVLKVSANSVLFTVNATPENPIKNLCFVLKGWGTKDDAKVNVSGNMKQGTVRDTDGTYTKIVYIEIEGVQPLEISISK
jgi:hypothetical protein